MKEHVIQEALRDLHSALVERSRRMFEHLYGAVGPGELLQLLAHDSFFSWLRPLSRLMAEIDQRVEDGETIDDRPIVEVIERELGSDYLEALQDADVALAHFQVKRACLGAFDRLAA